MLERVLIQLTPKQLTALKTISQETGASVAWQIRQAVDDYLKKRRSV
jgi:hypothetical protein